MNDRGSSGPDEIAGSWTMETLPMSLRKELLERELKKLGFRRSGHDGPVGQQQQQPQGGTSDHPTADGSGSHGD
jgi:hypothetical protein